MTEPSPARIWDLHCHLSGVDGRTPAERMAQMIEIADRHGIERLCVYMGIPWSQDPTPDDFRKQNDQVLEALQHWHPAAAEDADLARLCARLEFELDVAVERRNGHCRTERRLGDG